MPTLTVTAKGQVTLKKELLEHMGLVPGDKVEIELLPDRCASLHAAKPSGRIEDVFGLLKGKSNIKATLEEIEETIQKGWAGEL